MSRTSKGRFGPTWWGIFEEHVTLGDDSTLVDLGTGTGTLLEMLRNRYPEIRLVGVEVQPLMLASAQQAAKRCSAEIVTADLVRSLPLPDGMADVVTVVMTMHELGIQGTRHALAPSRVPPPEHNDAWEAA